MQILVPLNFTEASLNAFDYAYKRFPVSEITVIHVISGVTNVNYPSHGMSGAPRDVTLERELEEIIKRRLNKEELPEHINIKIYYGEPVNVIRKFIKSHGYDAVFVGARDNYDLFDKIIGTTALGIIKTTTVPVYVIPRFGKYKEYKKIVVACDERINDPDVVLALHYWNNTNAQVKFLHVSDKEHDEEFEKAKEGLLEQLYESYQPPFSYAIEEVKAKKVGTSILANAYNYQADLLVSIARNANFLHSLIFKNLSKELILKSSIPMLFLHTSGK